MGGHRKKKAHFRVTSATKEVQLMQGMKQCGRGGFRGVARRVIWKLVRSDEPWELLGKNLEDFMNSEETIGPIKAQGMWGEGRRQVWRS